MKNDRKQLLLSMCLLLSSGMIWIVRLPSFKGLFELLHVDIAAIRFSAKLVVDPMYCLHFLDLFALKI